MAEQVSIEVVYALPEQAYQLSVSVPKGTSVREAVLQVAAALPQEASVATAALGIFGQRLAHPEQQPVASGDRVEIYRPLLIDPKEVRRRRAERSRTQSA